MPPNRKKKQPENGRQVDAMQNDLHMDNISKKQRALDASKGLSAYHEMCDRNLELEVMRV